MLRDDVEQYTKLTGEDGWHTPIMKVGVYLDGYNKGLELLNKIRAEIMDTGAYEQETNGRTEFLRGINYCLSVIDEYKTLIENKESKEQKDVKKCPFCGGNLYERVADNKIHVDYCPKCDAAWKQGG